MTTPSIMTVAITGSLPQNTDNPAVPVTISEQIESTHAAFEAGAVLAHCHVRKDEGSPTSDPDRYALLMEGIIFAVRYMIYQLPGNLGGNNA